MQLVPKNSLMIICDVQKVFANRIFKFESMLNNTKFLLRSSKALEMPLLVSTHYQKAFGNTFEDLHNEINEVYGNEFHTFEKRTFSMLNNDCKSILDNLKKTKNIDTIIFTGIETHICVQQSCLDLLEAGYKGKILHILIKKKLFLLKTVLQVKGNLKETEH